MNFKQPKLFAVLLSEKKEIIELGKEYPAKPFQGYAISRADMWKQIAAREKQTGLEFCMYLDYSVIKPSNN